MNEKGLRERSLEIDGLFGKLTTLMRILTLLIHRNDYPYYE